MKKIIFAGAYGIDSLGDDAGMLFLSQKLKEIYINEIEFVVLDRHANERKYDRYGIRSVQNLEYHSREESLGKFFRGFNYDDDRNELKKLFSK